MVFAYLTHLLIGGKRRLEAYFERTTRYLKSVDQYAWMVAEEKRVRKVIAYSHKVKNVSGMVIPSLGELGIEVLSAKKVLDYLCQCS